MARLIVVGLCLLAMLATLAFVPVSRAQTESGLQLVTADTLPNSREVKFPHVFARDGVVHATGVTRRSTVNLWSKADSAVEFANPFALGGSAGGLPDYLNTSVVAAPDGALYATWTHLDENRIYLRRREPNGTWGPNRIVANADFPIFAEVGVGTDGTVFVVWNEPSRTARYRVSRNQGASWSGTVNLGETAAFSDQMDIATSPIGEVAVVWTGTASDLLQIFIGIWNGNSFNVRRITTLDTSYADATVTYSPSGTLYVAWRGTNNGVFYAERKPDGTFPRSRLTGNTAEGLVNINADESGNLHFSWVAKPSGSTILYYAYKEASSPDIRGPISYNDGTIFNPHASASVGSQIYNHVVYEQFSGGLNTRYALFRAEGSVLSAQPSIEDGAAAVGGKTSVSVGFVNVRGGTPNQVRYRWGAPPSDTATDSGGWTSFANPLAVTVPQAIRESTACQPSTLYTQVRNTTTGVTESSVKQDAILIDAVVEGEASVANPFLYTSAQEAPAELSAVAGATGGEPDHTRVPLMYLNVRGDDDCTDLKSIGIGRSADSIETVLQISDEGYAGFVPLPGLTSLRDGRVPVVLQLTDGAGNRRTFNSSLVFDETPPQLDAADPGALSATADPSADLLQDLTFSDIKVSDAQYSQTRSRGFWGVWLAVSRTPVANPAAADLEWVMVGVPGNSTTFTVQDFSLASGLAPSQVTAGTYYVYARFLDGAGNPSDEALALTVTSQANRPELYLPAVLK